MKLASTIRIFMRSHAALSRRCGAVAGYLTRAGLAFMQPVARRCDSMGSFSFYLNRGTATHGAPFVDSLDDCPGDGFFLNEDGEWCRMATRGECALLLLGVLIASVLAVGLMYWLAVLWVRFSS